MASRPSTDRAKNAALELVDRYGIISPRDIDLESIAWDLGIEVRESKLKNSEAQLIRKGKVGVIRIREGEKGQPRGRFSIGHEMGHWLLHEGKSQYWICTADQIHRYKGSPDEQEANAFSAELLLPSPIFGPMCRREPFSMATLERLADVFQTSLQATAIRMTEETTTRGMVVVSGDSEVRWSARGEALREHGYYIPVGYYPDENTLASFTEEEGNQPKTEVPADSWFPELLSPDSYRVYEETKRLKSYGLVISLLTVEER